MIKKILAVIYIAIVVWIGASWVDIVADNSQPNPQHSQYNFFVVAFDK